ncbi:hypothetical protein J6590_098943 [Homalodisca vitripennis]|nr:hypothetical protein J6590_098943 [Homalodisca vitripennis]
MAEIFPSLVLLSSHSFNISLHVYYALSKLTSVFLLKEPPNDERNSREHDSPLRRPLGHSLNNWSLLLSGIHLDRFMIPARSSSRERRLCGSRYVAIG